MPSYGRPGRLVGVITSAWALLLIILFFLNRGDDVGRLPALLRAFGASLLQQPVFGASGFVSSAAGLIIGGLMVLVWYGLGDLILRVRPVPAGSPDEPPRQLELASRCLIGAVAWSVVWFALGIGHFYRVWVAIAALVVGVGLAALARRLPRPSLKEPRGAPAVGRVALALIGLTQTLALMAALAPPTARDALIYHFAIPKAYVAAGGSVVVPYNMATFYPQGVEMQIVWAMLLGQPLGSRAAESAAGAAVFAFAPLLLLITYGWARERGLDRGWASVAAVMIAAIPTAYDVAGSGYVDVALAAWAAMAVHALGRWWVTLDGAWALRLALAIGGALSIKLTAAFLVLPLALLVLVRVMRVSRGPDQPEREGETRRRRGLAGIGALALGAAIAAPWYLRTWMQTGSPVFPFYLTVWSGEAPGWDLERSQLYQSLLSQYGDAQTMLDYLVTPIRLAIAAQPDQPERYDGVLGIAFLAAVPLLVWALYRRRLDVEQRIAALISTVMFVLWLFSSEQIRFLLPLLPGLAVAMTAAAAAAAPAGSRVGRLLRWLVLGAAAAGVPVIVAWFAGLDPVRVVLGGESRPQYLARRLEYYPYYELISRDLPPATRVWLINMRRDTYHLDRPYFSDFVFEDYTLRQSVRAAQSAADLRARIQTAGITHLLVRHDLLFNYARSPIVDDHQSREHNLAKLELMAAFFRDGTRLIRGDGKFWLIELPRPGS